MYIFINVSRPKSCREGKKKLYVSKDVNNVCFMSTNQGKILKKKKTKKVKRYFIAFRASCQQIRVDHLSKKRRENMVASRPAIHVFSQQHQKGPHDSTALRQLYEDVGDMMTTGLFIIHRSTGC